MVTAAVPLVLMLALVGTWGMQQQGKIAERDRIIATLNERQTSLDQLTKDGGTVTTMSLNAGPAAPQNAIGKIFFDPETLQAMLMVEGLKNTQPNASYEVWLTRNGSPVHVADLSVDENGSGTTWLDLDGPLSQYGSIRVTATSKQLAVGGGTDPSNTRDALQMDMPASPDQSDYLATVGWPDLGSGTDGGAPTRGAASTPAP